MKTCPSCRQPLPDDALFCPDDGTSLAAVETDPLLGSIIADRYVLLEKVGQGQSGTIYRAEHVGLRQRIAIKLLHQHLSQDAAAVERYREEATALTQLQTQHIVRVSDLGMTPDGRLFLAMEFLEGETLAALLGREGRLTEERAVGMLEQLGLALTEAHGLGYVHRDMRPRNVFVCQRGERDLLKLLDFGLAKLADPPASAAAAARPGHQDPRYASPEQARGDAPDWRSDIYTLGILAYEMVTGVPPFVGAGSVDVLTKHLEAQPVPIQNKVPGISTHYAGAVLRALCKKAKDRYATVARFLEALAGKAPVEDSAAEKAAVPGTRAYQPADKVGRAGASPSGLAASGPAAGASGRPSAGGASGPAATRLPAQQATPQDVPPSATLLGTGLDLQQVLQAQAAAQRATPAVAAPAPAPSPMRAPVSQAPAPSPAPSVQAAAVSAPAPAAAAAPSPPTTPVSAGLTTPPLVVASAASAAASAVRSPTPIPVGGAKPGGALPRKTSPELMLPSEQDLAALASGDPTQTGNWFAEGLAAEKQLATNTTSGPLPALYDAMDESVSIRRNISPALIIGGVVVVAAIALLLVFNPFKGGSQTDKTSVPKPAADAAQPATREPKPEPGAVAKPEPEPEPGAAQPTLPGAEVGAAAPKPATTAASGRAEQAKSEPKAAKAEPQAKSEPKKAAKVEPKPVKAEPKAKSGPKTAAKVEPKPVKEPKAKSEPKTAAKVEPKKGAGTGGQSAGADALVSAGRNSLQKGDYTRAKENFTKALAAAPGNPAAHAGLGELSFEMGQYAAAIQHLKAAVKASPRNARYQVMLGNAYFKNGKTQQAVDQYRRALATDPNNAEARAGLQAAVRRLAGGS